MLQNILCFIFIKLSNFAVSLTLTIIIFVYRSYNNDFMGFENIVNIILYE